MGSGGIPRGCVCVFCLCLCLYENDVHVGNNKQIRNGRFLCVCCVCRSGRDDNDEIGGNEKDLSNLVQG